MPTKIFIKLRVTELNNSVAFYKTRLNIKSSFIVEQGTWMYVADDKFAMF